VIRAFLFSLTNQQPPMPERHSSTLAIATINYFNQSLNTLECIQSSCRRISNLPAKLDLMTHPGKRCKMWILQLFDEMC